MTIAVESINGVTDSGHMAVHKMMRWMLPPVLFAVASAAQATLIDFTAANSASVTADGVTALVTPVNGTLTFQGFDGDSSMAPCTGLLACVNDGLGVNDDEVTYGLTASAEAIIVSFSQLVDITDIFLLDLFSVGDDGTNNAEIALVQFLDAGANQIGSIWSLTGTAAPGTQSGFATQSGLVLGVSSIRFFTNQVSNSDFAVAGLKFVTVPEPGTLSLLGFGLITLGFIARRRKVRK